MSEKNCRLCFKTLTHMDQKENHSEAFIRDTHILLEMFNIEINSFDDTGELPQISCKFCEEKLLSCYEFFQTIERTQELLKYKITEVEPPENIVLIPNDLIKTEMMIDEPYQAVSPVPDDLIKTEVTEEKPCQTVSQNEDFNEQNPIPLPFQCGVCFKQFATASLAEAHVHVHISGEIHQSLKVFQCHECLKSFTEKWELNIHLQLDHNTYVCKTCEKPMRGKSSLEYHLRLHMSAEDRKRMDTFICKQCGEGFSKQYFLNRHVNKVHLKLHRVICDICAKSFQKSAFLYHYQSVHLKLPEVMERFQCSFCKKSYKHQLTLKEHVSGAHMGEKLHKCHFCPKRYNFSGNMYMHMKKEHPESKSFSLKSKS